jgi:hypothetical protein
MRRVGEVIVVATIVLVFTGAAAAFMGTPGTGMDPGMMGMGMTGMGMTGMGMMGPGGCPGMAATGTAATPITEEKARELAETYATKYLPGFAVDKVLPVTSRFHTMYSVELKGPNDEVRVLHVNPFGVVMPFGGPWRRGA